MAKFRILICSQFCLLAMVAPFFLSNSESNITHYLFLYLQNGATAASTVSRPHSKSSRAVWLFFPNHAQNHTIKQNVFIQQINSEIIHTRMYVSSVLNKDLRTKITIEASKKHRLYFAVLKCNPSPKMANATVKLQ